MRWDALGETRVSFGGAVAHDLEGASAALDACTLALVVHDFHRAAVLGTATLLRARGRLVLLTAAHLFDTGTRMGNILAPLASGHGFVSLAGARVSQCEGADIATVELCDVAGAALLVRGRVPAVVPHPASRRRRRRPPRDGARALVSGYPAVLSRFDRGWLGARRFTLVTCPLDLPQIASRGCDRVFDYGRIACRTDGVPIHTPELQGMSGAGIWTLERPDGTGEVRLRLEAVQSSYVHGRFLRGHDVGAVEALLQARPRR